jgi:hypothetical protein
MKPLARKRDIFVENLPEEVVLYNKSNNKVHCLNKTAAAIWESCDGTRTVDELAHIAEAELGAPAGRKVALRALEELEKADLLEAGGVIVADAGLTSRREAVGKIALAGTALVATIVAAAPAAHASCHDRKPTPPPPPPPLWPPRHGKH